MAFLALVCHHFHHHSLQTRKPLYHTPRVYSSLGEFSSRLVFLFRKMNCPDSGQGRKGDHLCEQPVMRSSFFQHMMAAMFHLMAIKSPATVAGGADELTRCVCSYVSCERMQQRILHMIQPFCRMMLFTTSSQG